MDGFRNLTASLPEDLLTLNFQVSRITSHPRLKSIPYTDTSIKMTKEELRRGKWVKINVSSMVVEFFKLSRDYLSVTVRIQDSKNKTKLAVPHTSSEHNRALMPYIELFLRDNTHTRTRRTLGMDCAEGSKEVRCCRYPLKVNFEDFGWDWIIAPKQYEANYCSGECPFSYLQKYPHTHLVHLTAAKNNGATFGIRGPCCTPRKLSSISMLYYDNDFNIIYGTLPGMVVESCGCS